MYLKINSYKLYTNKFFQENYKLSILDNGDGIPHTIKIVYENKPHVTKSKHRNEHSINNQYSDNSNTDNSSEISMTDCSEISDQLQPNEFMSEKHTKTTDSQIPNHVDRQQKLANIENIKLNESKQNCCRRCLLL